MYLGIDIGTSAVKAVLVDETGRPVQAQTIELSVRRPRPGWAEQDPQSWWSAADKAVQALRAASAQHMQHVRGIGLSGQMHGLTALDKGGDVLRPAILWNDTRSAKQAAMLDENPAFRAISGNAVMPGFTAPKAVWLAEHEPELFAQTAKFLLPKDYLRYRLTGEMVSEMSDAAGTLWLDVGNRCWSPELLSASGLSPEHMPDVIEGSQISAYLRTDIARSWGIAGRPFIAGGGGDNACAAAGLGVVCPGDGFLSLGTSGVVFSVTDKFIPAAAQGAHTFCHALPDRWHQMGVILAASDCIAWLCEVTGKTVHSLITEMDKTDPAETSLLFHPYLSGERTPHNDAGARGGFFGLQRHHHAGHMMRAVMQGVAFAIADAMDVLAHTGGVPDSLIATGGGAKNRHWLEMIASLLQRPLLLSADSDTGAAVGAARLAMVAGGASVDRICVKPDLNDEVQPDPAMTERLKEARIISHTLYQQIRPLLPPA